MYNCKLTSVVVAISGRGQSTHAQIEADNESQLPVHLNSRRKAKPLYCAGAMAQKGTPE